MAKPKSRKKRAPKRVLALPDLEHAKTGGPEQPAEPGTKLPRGL